MSGLPLPRGFRWASGKAGLKASGKPDLALALAGAPASAAAVFTRNRVVAAPVVVGREHLERTGGKMRAVLVNSGNANCATGPAGEQTCREVCGALARTLGVATAEVFPSSTGIIGVPLPGGKITAALSAVADSAQADEAALRGFAQAIMTTDTRPKLASAQCRIGGKTVALAGVAKGAGMIHPDFNTATMLAYVFTDVAATPAELRRELRAAADASFNCISVDGDTSTNDTLLLLASGASGARLASGRKRFAAALLAVCQSLSEQIVADGEGVKHVVRLRIEQARSVAEARKVAETIATSSLVKTAWAGADPNWGRILAAAGRSGVALDPAQVTIRFGAITVFQKGRAAPFDAGAAHRYLSQPSYEVTVALGRGKALLSFLTCDLTTEYVHINADYST